MNLKVTYVYLILSFVKECLTKNTLKVFDFENAFEDTEQSFVSLENENNAPVPDDFILCASHFLEMIANWGIFQLFTEDGKPWMIF